MKYASTRQGSPVLNFEDTILQGLAPDGGLYVPEFLPQFSVSEIKEMKKLNYQDLVYKIITPFIGNEISEIKLREIINKSYQNFSHAAIAPTKQISHNEYLLELFHGPTLAFKDFALQLLGNLLDYVLTKSNQKIVIIGATSGDTGSAAIMGCKACKNAEIFILHPHNRVSNVQRKQMTTVIEPNVHNIALEGNFDDCQAMVKKMFLNQAFLGNKKMVAVNSINWARIMAQIVYYFYSALRLGAESEYPVSFVVPTGNFGDIYAGYLAKKMGLPIRKLVIATNSNDILARFINANDYTRKDLIDTLSPSMNIQVSSNFERLLFDVHKSKNFGSEVAKLMKDFELKGSLKVDNEILTIIRNDFSSYKIDDQQTIKLISDIYKQTAEVVDPHTAIGIGASREYINSLEYKGESVVILATAHPAKFPEAIEKSLNKEPSLPTFLADLFDRKEKMQILTNDIKQVQGFISNSIK